MRRRRSRARARPRRYPDRPIRVIIPYTAGGVAETIMRLLAVSMEQRLGQKLVIEAKPGAAGNIGTQEVARAEPDGYTHPGRGDQQLRHQPVPA